MSSSAPVRPSLHKVLNEGSELHHMRSRVKLWAGIALGGFILAVAGCQSGDSGSVLGLGKEDAKPAEPKVLESELRAYCPKVILREGTAVFSAYAKGGDGDPAKLNYQASITDVTRSCSRSGDTLTINVAVAGKIVPGPLAAPGSVTLPIRIVATRDSEVLYTQIHQHPASTGDASAATQFVFNDPNVSMPNPAQSDIMLYAGFDEGPAKKKAPEAE
jgi:hypothetical protein